MTDRIADKTQHLVALVKDGDESALNQLCAVYGPRVHWIMRIRMGNELRSKLESMDLVQETLISALRGLEDFKYENEGDLVRWLATIAENVIPGNLRRLHADKRDIRREVSLAAPGASDTSGILGPPGPIDATTPSVIVSRQEDLVKLERAISQLKPDYKEEKDQKRYLIGYTYRPSIAEAERE